MYSLLFHVKPPVSGTDCFLMFSLLSNVHCTAYVLGGTDSVTASFLRYSLLSQLLSPLSDTCLYFIIDSFWSQVQGTLYVGTVQLPSCLRYSLFVQSPLSDTSYNSSSTGLSQVGTALFPSYLSLSQEEQPSFFGGQVQPSFSGTDCLSTQPHSSGTDCFPRSCLIL